MKFRIAPRPHLDKFGKSLLYLIVKEGEKKLQINLNLYVNKEEWNSKTQRFQPKQASEAINLYLGEIDSKIHKIKLDYFANDRPLTLDKFEYEFKSGFSRVDFIQFAESVCETEDGLLAKNSNKKEDQL